MSRLATGLVSFRQAITWKHVRRWGLGCYGLRCVYSGWRDLHSGLRPQREGWEERSATVYGSLGVLGGMDVLLGLYGGEMGWSSQSLASIRRAGHWLGLLGWGTALPARIAIWRRPDRGPMDSARAWMTSWLTAYYALVVIGVRPRRVVPLMAIGILPVPATWTWLKMVSLWE